MLLLLADELAGKIASPKTQTFANFSFEQSKAALLNKLGLWKQKLFEAKKEFKDFINMNN